MGKMPDNYAETDAWNLLKHHFLATSGLFDQIKQGATIPVHLNDQPEVNHELQAIRQAMTALQRFWKVAEPASLPKWQLCILWKALTSLDTMIQQMPENSLMLPILQAKLSRWFAEALNYQQPLQKWFYRTLDSSEQKNEAQYLIEHDIEPITLRHLRSIATFFFALRLYGVSKEDCDQFIQSVTALCRIWNTSSTIPHLAAQLFIDVPLWTWSGSWLSQVQQGQRIHTQQRVYALIGELLCG